jgi:hypothetical protein
MEFSCIIAQLFKLFIYNYFTEVIMRCHAETIYSTVLLSWKTCLGEIQWQTTYKYTKIIFYDILSIIALNRIRMVIVIIFMDQRAFVSPEEILVIVKIYQRVLCKTIFEHVRHYIR